MHCRLRSQRQCVSPGVAPFVCHSVHGKNPHRAFSQSANSHKRSIDKCGPHGRAIAASLLIHLPPRVQIIEIQNRVKDQEVATRGLAAPERIV